MRNGCTKGSKPFIATPQDRSFQPFQVNILHWIAARVAIDRSTRVSHRVRLFVASRGRVVVPAVVVGKAGFLVVVLAREFSLFYAPTPVPLANRGFDLAEIVEVISRFLPGLVLKLTTTNCSNA